MRVATPKSLLVCFYFRIPMEGQVEEANHEGCLFATVDDVMMFCSVPERLVRHTRSTHARVRPKVMEIAEYETSGIKVNKKGLRSTFDLAAQCPNCEVINVSFFSLFVASPKFMYLRENEIREFKAPKPMYFLRVCRISKMEEFIFGFIRSLI